MFLIRSNIGSVNCDGSEEEVAGFKSGAGGGDFWAPASSLPSATTTASRPNKLLLVISFRSLSQANSILCLLLPRTRRHEPVFAVVSRQISEVAVAVCDDIKPPLKLL